MSTVDPKAQQRTGQPVPCVQSQDRVQEVARQNSLRRSACNQTCNPQLRIQLRAFQPQQHQCMLLELELPRVLAPDLSSSGYSSVALGTVHYNHRPICNLPVLLFLVTASTTYCHWAICVPAAILRSGRRFSGALSGVEPQFPVLVIAMTVHCTVIIADKAEIRPVPRQAQGPDALYRG
eukprot:TRINITY_DN1019_c0_g2_i1.p1 TRINITY_DN1019_c0_g2~~TRINITY_DN1019_c0_g2_i1.p1  ORF type:complete len:179 (-),score=0.25 TRINITY_DN1019_c0_g2_i1:135-671(-)